MQLSSFKFKSQLRGYSIAASAILAGFAFPAKGGIIYTDVNPDLEFHNNNDILFLDLNNDGITDFTINLFKIITSTTLTTGFKNYLKVGEILITPLNNNEIYGSTSTVYGNFIPSAASANVPIKGNLNWLNNTYMAMALTIYETTNGNPPVSSSLGKWVDAKDKFLGLKLLVQGNVHYGWARLSVDSGAQTFTLKDYAYEDVPCHSILTGDTASIAANAVTNIMAFDIADNNDASDLYVTFDKAPVESKIGLYKIYVIKSAKADTFNLGDACNVGQASTKVVIKTGNNISTLLDFSMKDTDGDAITNGIPYKIRVLSTGDGSIATIDTLSAASNEITLQVGANPATSLVLSDIANNGNGADVQVSFNKASDESTVDEYRVIILRSSDAPDFNLIDANNVPSNLYHAVGKTGNNLTIVLNASSKDVDGALIKSGVAYKAKVLSIADGVNAKVNSLSNASNKLTLSFTGIQEVNEVSYVDVYSFQNKVYINFVQGFEPVGTAVVYDMSGKEIKSVSLNNRVISMVVDYPATKTYILKLFLKDQVLSKKIYLNKP